MIAATSGIFAPAGLPEPCYSSSLSGAAGAAGIAPVVSLLAASPFAARACGGTAGGGTAGAGLAAGFSAAAALGRGAAVGRLVIAEMQTRRRREADTRIDDLRAQARA